MLTEYEKSRIETMWLCGWSYQEMALELLIGRSTLGLSGLAEEVKAYIKEKDQWY